MPSHPNTTGGDGGVGQSQRLGGAREAARVDDLQQVARARAQNSMPAAVNDSLRVVRFNSRA